MPISPTLRATHQRKVESGIHPSSLPIGYVPCCLIAEPDPVRAPLIAQAIHYAAKGWTLREIKVFLDGAGFLTKHRKQASLDAVGDMVKNPFYAGYIPWKGRVYPGRHEAIVPLSLIQEAERQLARKRVGGGRVRKGKVGNH